MKHVGGPPPIEGVAEYLKVFDVDDPFDQIHGPQGLNDLPNVGLIDDDTIGPDGRLPGGATRHLRPWRPRPLS